MIGFEILKALKEKIVKKVLASVGSIIKAKHTPVVLFLVVYFMGPCFGILRLIFGQDELLPLTSFQLFFSTSTVIYYLLFLPQGFFVIDRYSLLFFSISASLIGLSLFPFGIPLIIGGLTLPNILSNFNAITPTNRRWIIWGVCIGILATILYSLILFLDLQWVLDYNFFYLAIGHNANFQSLITQIMNVSTEEFLFRGFLWGFLSSKGWSKTRVFWIQGLVFWLWHLPKILIPVDFFISMPNAIFCMSFVYKRSQQLFSSILVHGLINGISVSLVYWIYQFLLK